MGKQTRSHQLLLGGQCKTWPQISVFTSLTNSSSTDCPSGETCTPAEQLHSPPWFPLLAATITEIMEITEFLSSACPGNLNGNTKTSLRSLPVSGHWGRDRDPWFFVKAELCLTGFVCLRRLSMLCFYFFHTCLFLEHKMLRNYAGSAIRRDPSVQGLLKTTQKIL